MDFEIKNDVGAMLLQHNFAATNKEFMGSLQKLSTGLKINSAADDAANLALSEKLDSKIREQNELSRISQMEDAMTKVAESDLSAINDNVQRMRDLAMQASNGVYSDSERQAIQQEVTMLNDEINRVAKSSSFNEKKLLDGTADGTKFMAAESANVSPQTAFKSAAAADIGIDSIDVTSPENARALMEKLDGAMETISGRRSELGALSNRLESNVERHEITSENLAASNSTIRDTDIAKEMSNMIHSQILMDASVAMQSQANSASNAVYGLLKT